MKCSQLVVNNIHQHLICSGSVLSVVSPATRWLSSHQKLRCQHLPMVSISPKLFPSQNLLVYLLSRLFSITGCRWAAPLFSPWHSCTHGHSGRADQLESRCQESIPSRQHAANTAPRAHPVILLGGEPHIMYHILLLPSLGLRLKKLTVHWEQFDRTKPLNFSLISVMGWGRMAWCWDNRAQSNNVYFCQISFYIKLPASGNMDPSNKSLSRVHSLQTHLISV